MLTVGDLGILREVSVDGGRVVVSLTPTYSGCPALREIQHDVSGRLAAAGFCDVEVRLVLSPAWSTDWITAEGRRKLAAAGIAPPAAAPRRARRPGATHAQPEPRRSRLPCLRIRRIRSELLRSAAPLARTCTGAWPARSRSSTSRRSDCDRDH